MIYQHANRASYEDFAAGRALFHAPGMTNFPARLAEELMGRSLDLLGVRAGVTLYDPLCGAGSLLAVAAFTHASAVAHVRGTDADAASIETAQKNLALLAPGALSARAEALREMGERYARASYAEAVKSTLRLEKLLPEGGIVAEAFACDVFALPDDGFRADVVLTDLPYGDMKAWTTGEAADFLTAIGRALRPGGIACVVMDKAQKCVAEGYVRLERQNVGKRRFDIYRRER